MSGANQRAWFDVDKKGLSKLLERRGKAFVALELLQNAWDQNVTKVDVELHKEPGSRDVTIIVEDDDPEGFSDLAHAFTLFAESEKKVDPGKRGRFNLGEKLVLALCQEASIESTKGRVRFDAAGRKKSGKVRRRRGSRFEGSLRMKREEQEETIRTLHRVIAPRGIETRINGERIEAPEPVREFKATLTTEVADAEGYLRPTKRKTLVRVFRPRDGEVATLYEMGIPVVETGDLYHLDIAQKVPLSMERDNVPPAYLRALRTAVLNEMHGELDSETAASGWVREALSDPRCAPEAAKSAVEARFGTKAVAYDPSDAEANKLAVAKGYTVVHGGTLSKGEWENARKAGVLTAAGQVTPSPKPFSNDPCAPSLRIVKEGDWSQEERRRVEQIKKIAERLIGRPIEVVIANDQAWPYEAAFGGVHLTINRARVGKRWFQGALTERVLSLVIHELGHYYEGDHLSSRFHDALCDLGARLAIAVSEESELLKM